MEWAGQLTGIDEDVYFEVNSNVLSDIVLEQEDAQERTEKPAKRLIERRKMLRGPETP